MPSEQSEERTFPTVEQIRDRPPARVMAIGPARDEMQALVNLRHDIEIPGDVYDEVNNRIGALIGMLEERCDPPYPPCPDCGASSHWIDEYQGFMFCDNCSTAPDDELTEQIRSRKRKYLYGAGSA